MNFLDPLLTEDGKPYAPKRFEEIIKERYYISKHCNTSYIDVGKMTPRERVMIMNLIVTEVKQERDQIAELKAQIQSRER